MTELAVKYEISTLDRFEAIINEARGTDAGIDIAGPEDKEGYRRTKAALSDIKKTIVKINKDRKAIKEPLLRAAGEVEEKAQILIDMFRQIESPLLLAILAYEHEKKKIKQEKIMQELSGIIRQSAEITVSNSFVYPISENVKEEDESKWTDSKRWEVFLNTLSVVAIPKMKHPRHRARVNKAIKLLKQIKELKIVR